MLKERRGSAFKALRELRVFLLGCLDMVLKGGSAYKVFGGGTGMVF